jgi:hypothetical protein
MIGFSRRLAAALACLALAACAENGTSISELDRTVAEVRAATAKYANVDKALADGYTTDGHCVAHPTQGGMGIHYVKMSLMGDAASDPAQPEVLVYAPQPDGSLKFAAVEYMIFRQPWEAAGNTTAPRFVDQPFDQSFGEAAHGLPDHYELHVWTEMANASGRFNPWNPAVKCPGQNPGH